MKQTRILVVEDESIVAMDLRQRLESLGYEVINVVMTAEKAIAGAGEKRPDLVMMDIGLAGPTDGIEAAEEIRRRFQIPVVYVTAYSDNATLQRAKITEPFGYVLKPFDERELRTTIEMALYKHALDTRLKESEARYRSLVETSPDGISLIDPGGRILFCNTRMVLLHGFADAREMLGKNMIDLFAPEERARGQAELEQLLQRGRVANAEHTLLRKDGTCFPAELSASVIVEGEGRNSAMMCITRDISGRKLAEKKLRESEELFRVIAEVSPAGIFRTDADGRIIYANERACQISDLALDAMLGLGWASAVHQEDRARILQEWHGAVTRHSPLRAEYRVMSKAGGITWILSQADVEYDAAGAVAGYVGTLTDITERKEVEEELRSKNAFLRDILESSSAISVISTDLQNRILFWNTGAENMLGYKAEEIVRRGTIDILYPDDEPQTLQAVMEMRDYVLHKKLSISREIKEIRKDGRKLWVNVTVSPRFDERGNVTGMLGIGEDITERKFAEHATKQAERELRLLAFTLNCAKDSFCITDMENNILFVNQSFLDTYGYSEEELPGQNIEILRSASVPPELPEQIRAKTREGGWSGEIMNRRKDGSDFPIELWTSVVRDDAGDPVALVGVARDITDRKRAEDRIQASLREKEVLLKEIHHRVKNNLQVIASLLNLQAATIKDEHTLTVFKESQNRVKSMSLVHQELYQSEDLARIDFAEYIRKLTTNLLLSYGVDSPDIELKRNVSDVFLPVDTAIPCGLIINELVSNSLKYAFPDGKKGQIGVTFHQADEQYTLTVSDNGVGFPKTLDFRKTETLGLQLVNTLTRQLRGSIGLDTSSGTAFTLIFGEKEKIEIVPEISAEH